MQKVVSIESRLKESRDAYKSHRQGMHFIDDNSDCSDDHDEECLATEINWLAENKLITCPSLKLIDKNLNEEMKFTFDFSKCNRIFD